MDARRPGIGARRDEQTGPRPRSTERDRRERSEKDLQRGDGRFDGRGLDPAPRAPTARRVVELARAFHHFYDACRVIQTDQPELTQARLAVCGAARRALAASLELLGVSAPERMDRSDLAGH